MLTRLVRFALAQRLFILLAGALLAGAGWYAFRNLPIDAFPDVSNTQDDPHEGYRNCTQKTGG